MRKEGEGGGGRDRGRDRTEEREAGGRICKQMKIVVVVFNLVHNYFL